MAFVRVDKLTLERRGTKFSYANDTRGYVSSSTNSTWVANQGSRNIYSDPDWRVKIAEGQDATQPYTRSSWVSSRGPRYNMTFSWKDTRPGGASAVGGFRTTHSHLASSNLSVPGDSALQDLALQRIKRKLNTLVNRRNNAVPIVELREMRGLVRGIADESMTFCYNFARLLAGIKSAGRTKRNAKHLFQQAQRLWLTYSFGIRPMINDLNGVFEQIQKSLDAPSGTERLTAGARKQWSDSATSTSTGTYSWTQRNVQARHHTLAYKYTAGFVLDVLSSENYGIAAQNQFTFRDLPSIGWELLPFSWMFDYFTNVSKVLDDTFVSPPGFTKYVVLNTLYTCEIDEWVDMKYTPLVSGEVAALSSETSLPGKHVFRYFSRAKLGSLPRLGFHFKSVDQIGDTKNVVSKLLNLCSLLGNGRSIKFN